MFTVVSGDMFAERYDYLVNTVNCVGVSGKGLALQFRNRYPSATTAYTEQCKAGLWKPGMIAPFMEKGQQMLFVSTKDHWRDRSRYEWIESICIKMLWYLEQEASKRNKIISVAIPPMGAGLGGLDANVVQQYVEYRFADTPLVNVFYYGR
jgi:O-acetyl-ADP-ribose deacetylase (regulator of RNase III)